MRHLENWSNTLGDCPYILGCLLLVTIFPMFPYRRKLNTITYICRLVMSMLFQIKNHFLHFCKHHHLRSGVLMTCLVPVHLRRTVSEPSIPVFSLPYQFIQRVFFPNIFLLFLYYMEREGLYAWYGINLSSFDLMRNW